MHSSEFAADTVAATHDLPSYQRVRDLARKVDALPGFEAVTKVAFPPLIGLVQVAHLHFVGFRVLGKPVAKSEVAIETHEFPKINVGDARVTSNDEHVLVIIGSGSLTKVCRTANYQWVGAQWID